MTRNEYLHQLIRHYLEAPDTPHQARPQDWAIAADLYRQAVPLPDLLHAIRLATLRRNLTAAHPPIHSLAYYRAVLRGLTPEELHPHYVCYVRRSHQLLKTSQRQAKPRLHNQNPALPHRR